LKAKEELKVPLLQPMLQQKISLMSIKLNNSKKFKSILNFNQLSKVFLKTLILKKELSRKQRTLPQKPMTHPVLNEMT
jgi:hypothetical protein